MSKEEAEARLDEHMDCCQFCSPKYKCPRYRELAKIAGKETEDAPETVSTN